MATKNDITGDLIKTKLSDTYADNFDSIFRNSDWDEKRMDVIGSNGNDGEHYEWQKHDGSIECPIDKEATVEVETWTPNKVVNKANNLNWQYVKFYRIIKNEL